MNYIVVQDKMTIVKEEIWHLERLLNNAHMRKRFIMKKTGEQSWWDWICEFVGY